MKKILACLVLVGFLFQMTSCYRYVFYYLYYDAIQTEEQTMPQTHFTYQAETKTTLESGAPLESYIVYNGVTDALPSEGSFRPAYRQGICRNFKGKPVVVLLFMDDEESVWTAEEVESFTQENVMPALGFLKQEAERWGVELDFTVESYSTATTEYTMDFFGVMPTESDEAVKEDLFEQAAGDLGFASDWVLYSYMQSQYPSEEIIFLTILNKDGRSFAVKNGYKGFNRHVEHCVIYGKTSWYPAQTVAHEILHLFGAEDLYEEVVTTGVFEIAQNYYSDDIMLNLLPNWKNKVGDYTAYAIGWTHEIPDVCYLDDWYID